MTGRLAGTVGCPRETGTVGELASLREDYLNQVQRDFLSRCLRSNTPSGCTGEGAVGILVDGRRLDAQQAVKPRAGGGVLQRDALGTGLQRYVLQQFTLLPSPDILSRAAPS